VIRDNISAVRKRLEGGCVCAVQDHVRECEACTCGMVVARA
jgi:hypothetical protein